jgi:tetratricopeptide (TPR) repeat protein/tRNA A-37 threonylcarbamoyl transferase component Bud32
MIGRTISHYEILEQIGDGGMGTVYKALDTKLKVHRALKFIHPHLVTDEHNKHRFTQEAQAASSLDHPNICGIHEVDETSSGRPFICMTYYDGVTLSERMKQAPLPAREVFQMGLSIAQGLMCAHQNGIIHRDIKPSNIMITTEGYIKILDFGLAKLAGIAGVTKTGVSMGTVRYMSPEQGSGQEVDHRTDIWSLGLIMYELTTGTYPFTGDFDPAVIYSILNTEPPPAHEVNPDIPESHSRVIARCLEKDPDQRYQSIAELLGDMGSTAHIEGWDSSLGHLVLPISDPSYPHRRPKRPPWLRITLAAVTLAVAIAAMIYWTSRPPALYTTDLRVAVMPLKNKAHPAQDFLTDGLTDVVCQVLDQAARIHDSMWLVPNRLVLYSNIAEDGLARNTFGVNRIVTGGLERFEGGQVLRLALRDAESMEQIRVVRVPYDPQTTELQDSLPGSIMRLVGLDRDRAAEVPPYLPSSGPAATHYLQGVGALQAKDYTGAMIDLGLATESAPEFGMGWCALGWAQWLEYVRTGEELLFGEAVHNLEQSATLVPGIWWPRFYLGEVYRKSGQAPEALSAFLAANALDPGNPVVCRGLSRVYRGEKRFTEAEAILMTTVEMRPDYFEAPRVLALYYYRTDEMEASLIQLDKSLALAPDDAYSLNTKGVIFVGRGEFIEARGQFERAFALAPNCETCSNIGTMLFYEDKFRESASYFELSMEYCGQDDSTIWANWAKALYWAEGGREESFSKFQKAIELTWEKLEQSPGDPELIGDLIDFHAMMGDEETTRRLIATGDSLAVDDGDLLFRIGNAYELIGDRGAAVRYITEAVRHGVPLARIQETPELADLNADPRFARMVSAASGQEEAKADSVR